jgi:hypothetical protein
MRRFTKSAVNLKIFFLKHGLSGSQVMYFSIHTDLPKSESKTATGDSKMPATVPSLKITECGYLAVGG